MRLATIHMLVLAICNVGEPVQVELLEVENVPLVTAAKECGFDRDDIIVGYADDVQEHAYVVTESGSRSKSSAAACLIYWNAGKGNFLKFQDVELQAKLYRVESEFYRRMHHEFSEGWLEGASLRIQARAFDPTKETLVDFLHHIEATCKVEPSSLLQIHEKNLVSYKLKGLEWLGEKAPWTFACTGSMLKFAEFEKQGIRFGFAGNEVAGWEVKK